MRGCPQGIIDLTDKPVVDDMRLDARPDLIETRLGKAFTAPLGAR